MTADLYVGDQLCLQAMGVFGHGRPSRRVQAERPIEMAPPDSGIAFDTHVRQLPSFLHFFEGSWVNGVMPFSGQTAREMKFWVRHRELLTDFPIERLVTLADIPPPVILSHYRTPPVPSSSLSWSLEFVEDPGTVDTDWCYLEFDLEAAAEGYTQQSGRLYDEQGKLLLMSRQCMVFFEPATGSDSDNKNENENENKGAA
jgi:acyl-CoA thioesterase